MAKREAGVVRVKPEYAGKVADYLPTRGRQGFADDLVSTNGTLGLESINAGFSDEEAFIALEKLVFGPIGSFHDLQNAEAALQSLMFFDHVSLLTPAWAMLLPDGKYGIARPELGSNCQPYMHELPVEDLSDQVVIGEYLTLQGSGSSVVAESTFADSQLIGRRLPSDIHEYLTASPKIAGLLAAYPAAHSMPAYFANPCIQQFYQEQGTFANKLYTTFDKNIMEAGAVVPGSKVEVRLPIFIWALLSRVNTRAEIPQAILNMREEFQTTRDELVELDKRMRSLTKQRERIMVAKHYTEAFEKIVNALGQNNFSYTRHVIYSIVKTFRDIPTAVIQAFNPQWEPAHPKSYVNRSVAAKAFLELADFENANHIVATLDFTDEERALIACGP